MVEDIFPRWPQVSDFRNIFPLDPAGAMRYFEEMTLRNPELYSLGIPLLAMSPRGEGLALRGIFVLVLVPLAIWAMWKKRRR